jgi:hypothetical protein
MGSIETKKIPLSKLELNLENPRFESVTNEKEAINLMIENLSNKLINLAKDILNENLNPSDLVQVTPNNTSNKYIVLEGNRRITSLKLLNKPALVDRKFPNFFKKLKPLAEQFKQKAIKNILCVVYSDPNDADRWIELKHTGENDGVGTVSWDTTQQQRFNRKRKGQNPIALQAIEFLSRSEYTDANLKRDLYKLPYTNIERLLTDPDIRNIVGISYKDKNLESNYPEKEVVKGLSKIAKDFLYNNYTVNNVRNKKDRLKYIEEFGKEDLPIKSLDPSGSWILISATNTETHTPETKQKPQTKGEEIPSFRKTLIPKDFILKINDPRPNKIYHELKNLRVEDFENSVAVTFRVFVELSIDAFIESKNGKIKGVKKMTPFKDKVKKTIEYFEDSKKLNDHQLKGISVLVDEPNGILSIDTFNAYVHNRTYSPKESHLINSWNDIQLFIQKIWEDI